MTSPALATGPDGRPRCPWGASPALLSYHDEEWGRPLGTDAAVLERLCLEGFQAGLSWLTVLRKREAFREAFVGFDPHRLSGFGEADVERLLDDARIVRHRAKIEAALANARAAVEVGSVAALVWSFEPPPPVGTPRSPAEIPATTPASLALSKELRRRGFRFLGPTTVYAAMQALGLVDDHLEGCVVRPLVERERAAFVRPR